MKALIVAVLFLGAAAALVGVAMSSSVPVLEIHTLRSAYAGGRVQVDGGKIVEVQGYEPLRFRVAPEGNPEAAIDVVSSSTAPENFKPGIDVSLRGDYDPEKNLLTAYRISTKCPSKYEASKEVGGESRPGGGAIPTGAPASGRIE